MQTQFWGIKYQLWIFWRTFSICSISFCCTIFRRI